MITDDENGFKWYLTFDEDKVTEAIPTLDAYYTVTNE